jgi:hypothetical protein
MAEMHAKQALIGKLTHEMATLKRIGFAPYFRTPSHTQLDE